MMRDASARMIRENAGSRGEDFLRISPETLGGGNVQGFAVYIERGGRMVLFVSERERFTGDHARALARSGTEHVFIQAAQLAAFHSHLEKRLPRVLGDASVSLEKRARVLYDASVSIVREAFTQRLPLGLGAPEYAALTRLVRKSAVLLANERSLSRIASLMTHDYGVYSHSVQVFVYHAVLLRRLGLGEDMIVKAGLGTLLHDVGKEGVDPAILQKPGPLTPEERRIINTHPARGAAFCAAMPLAPASLACILLHHERMDGGGYPGGLGGEQIPVHVRALSLADAYDALTSDRPYAKAERPYEALRIMRDEMRGAYDLDLFKLFVSVLSGADIL